jgi:hypothetical protein
MRYVVIDLQGNQRESFDSRDELVGELREIRTEDPNALELLYVLTRDDDGREAEPARRADEILVQAVEVESVSHLYGFLFDFVTASVTQIGAIESDEWYREFAARQESQQSAVAGLAPAPA